jgi:predicted negative regulator of RcsB-dependent stress response
MADTKLVSGVETSDVVLNKAKDFWGKYGKILSIASIAVILLAGGWYVYKNFVQKPKETKAADTIFKAEEYFRMDSVNLALNGDGVNAGFLKVAKNYSGTDAGNMANFYAGACYVKLNDNEKAITFLKKFSSSSKPTQARAYKLLGDAYGDLGKNKEAFDYYKKSGHYFESDAPNSAEALFLAAYLAQKSLNDAKGATALYTEIKEKYPNTEQAQMADAYLAQMGVYNTNN